MSSESDEKRRLSVSDLIETELLSGLDPEFAATYFRDTPESFLEWCKLCGCDRMYLNETYEEYFRLINSDYPRIMVLLPRGTYKSTALCAKCTRDIAMNRNERIAYFSETFKQAKAYVGWVRNQLENNRRIVDALGKFKPPRGVHKWSDEEMTVLGRTDMSKKEATLTGRGLDQVRAGPHYDKIIIDDPCSVGNTKTRDALETTKEYVKLVFAIAESTVDLESGERTGMTQIIVSCTRYHDDDALGYIERANEDIIKRQQRGDESAMPWKILKVPALDEDNEPTFRHLPQAVLDQQKDEMGPRVFSAQMMLDPIAGDKQTFHRPMFKIIPAKQLPLLDQMYRYLLTDTATTDNDDSDDVAFVAAGRDATGRDFVLDVVCRPMKPTECIEELFRMYMKWACRGVTMEKIAINDVYGAMIDQRCIDLQVKINVIPITGRSMESKRNRIESLEIPFSGGKIYFSSEIKPELIRVNMADKLCYGRLVDMFLRFPKTKDDHIPDAMSDLYKRDPKGKPLCPRPTVAEVMRARDFTTLNGQFANVNPQVRPVKKDFWGNLQQQTGRQMGGPYGAKS